MTLKDSLRIKQKIKKQFSIAAEDYDSKAFFQKKIAEELLEYLVPQLAACSLQLATILDIGCGTGFLTIPLKKTFSSARIFACDIAHPMIRSLQFKIQNSKFKIVFTTADCESLPYRERQFDLIVSNLTYQWLLYPEKALSEVYRVLKPGGIFSLSTLGYDTLKELRECYEDASIILNKDGLPPFMTFSKAHDIISKLKESGFKDISFAEDIKFEEYHGMLNLLKTLKSIGAGNPFDSSEKSLGAAAILKKMSEIYRQRFGTKNKIYATHEMLFFTAKK
ncbi:MAG: methyltransferase domain-containing protein [Deltaproteobacteria bacterium]|nr:methyltransferase domain-containing protein [Deltaproteobacteria bacterium]